MKILFIDDNQLLIDSVKFRLGPSYVVDSVDTGHDGVEQARCVQYGLIMLDLDIPNMDGTEVCRALRSAKIIIPILVLTAQRDPTLPVLLLNSGADDVITKPFSSDVLKAHIAALLRRGKELQMEKIIDIRDLTMNITRRQVWRSGVNISLRRKEFDILEYLIINRGHALTRSMILDHVWESGTEGWNNTVDVHIKHLRDKIDRPFSRPLIKTAYGIGYTLDDT